jgi:hypothetical protein
MTTFYVILSFLIGGILGAMSIAIFASSAYERGFSDGQNKLD